MNRGDTVDGCKEAKRGDHGRCLLASYDCSGGAKGGPWDYFTERRTMEVLRLHSIMARSWDGINTCWAQCHFGISTLEYFAMNVRFLKDVPSNGITAKEPCRRSKRSAG